MNIEKLLTIKLQEARNDVRTSGLATDHYRTQNEKQNMEIRHLEKENKILRQRLTIKPQGYPMKYYITAMAAHVLELEAPNDAEAKKLFEKLSQEIIAEWEITDITTEV